MTKTSSYLKIMKVEDNHNDVSRCSHDVVESFPEGPCCATVRAALAKDCGKHRLKCLGA